MERIKDDRKIVVSLEKVENSTFSSFHTGIYHQPFFSRSWHYHPEFELLLVTSGSGRRLVGDHAENFEENDLVLLGGLLPHAWISDSKFFKKDTEEVCESIYVQFRKEIFGKYFIDIPELAEVRSVLKLANRGIKIIGDRKNEIIALIREMPNIQPFEQLVHLLKILHLISSGKRELLATEDYLNSGFRFKSSRMIQIHEYLIENFQKDISIGTCAELVNMTVSSFCRYFKNETKENFTAYLNRFRIGFAKNILLNSEVAIKEIAYECGYNSVPYFNKQFKKYVGESPFSYRKTNQNIIK